MEKENPPRLLSAPQKHAAFIASRGWKSSNSSPLSVEGQVFSFTFPFIEQALALTTYSSNGHCVVLDASRPVRSLNPLVCKAVTSGPIGTLGARSSFRVVRAFFVRAADDAVGHDGGARGVRLDECQNLLTNGGVVAYIQIALGEPAFENIRVVIVRQDHANDDLGSQFIVGSVEGHGGNRVATKSGAGVCVQPRSRGRTLLAESLPSLHQCNIRLFAKLSKTAISSEHQPAATSIVS